MTLTSLLGERNDCQSCKGVIGANDFGKSSNDEPAMALAAENMFYVWPTHYQHDIPTKKVQENFIGTFTLAHWTTSLELASPTVVVVGYSICGGCNQHQSGGSHCLRTFFLLMTMLCVDHFSSACSKFGLTINTKTTEVLYKCPPRKPYSEPTIFVKDQKLSTIDQFTYLGSTLGLCTYVVNLASRFSRHSKHLNVSAVQYGKGLS